jgi:hypothetical protein
MKLTLPLFRLYMFLASAFLCSLMLIKELVGNGAYGFSTNLCLLESMGWLFSCIIQDGETGCLVIGYYLYVSKFFCLVIGVSWTWSRGCFTAAKPAYYNYVCVMLLLNGISLFGCFLVASGAGFGLWYIQNTFMVTYSPSRAIFDDDPFCCRLYNLTIVCYHSLYLPLLYVTFLADFFQVPSCLWYIMLLLWSAAFLAS